MRADQRLSGKYSRLLLFRADCRPIGLLAFTTITSTKRCSVGILRARLCRFGNPSSGGDARVVRCASAVYPTPHGSGEAPHRRRTETSVMSHIFMCAFVADRCYLAISFNTSSARSTDPRSNFSSSGREGSVSGLPVTVSLSKRCRARRSTRR